MNYFSHVKNNNISPLCRLCKVGKESAIHLVANCNPLWATVRERMPTYCGAGPDGNEEEDWTVAELESLLETMTVQTLMTTRIELEREE